ncbi:multiple epidermal growth factor-like domains protein 9 isoform X1 [Myxocyprinus asiaticus]|uniref:multiple epidermal growth factor-like domains protein 9 isoform X1 n=1 Tax=Myxocyprinus asiaticus TaxID=70543 RepID=UPI002223BCDD|nr:multiple epidermal growth factor-like domains protein 9 isoform X1 [Myxocyprinus asiaticus]
MRYSMLLVSILELLLFGCTAGLFRSAHRASDDDNSGARLPRAVLEEPLQATTIPNHLQEDDGNYRFSPFTPKMTITTKDSRTTGKTSQLQPLWVTTTTAAPVTKTIDPTFKRSRVKENSTFTTGLNITVKPTSSYPVNQTQNTPPPTLDTANSSWTVRSTSKPLFLTTEKGPQCNCSAEGSVDPDACDRFTGQCVCMTGYTGHWCDECEDKYFTNGTNGCQACDCDSYGAMSQLCNSSGVCMCKMGVHGDKCDDCRPGFSHFSSTGCQPCQCNNHSSYCHPQSGICENCQGNTIGPSCENCRYNFYRRPGSPATDACIPCPCSSVTSTGSCRLDSTGQPVCSQCKPEYQGPNCEQCSDGFYNADSICLPCNCSGNADPRTSPRICHPDTGHCLSCINNTTGLHCEHCAEGFTGDALTRNCSPKVVHTTPSTTTHWFHYSTMTSSPNATAQFTSTSLATTLITSLASSTPNTTTATVTPLPWNHFNIIVLAVIIIVVVALMAVVGGVYTYREYQNRKLNAPFWTIELKEDNISFSSYHDSIPNADISGLLEDEVSEMGNGQLALTGPGILYKV